jgi:hypothetical protein
VSVVAEWKIEEKKKRFDSKRERNVERERVEERDAKPQKWSPRVFSSSFCLALF